MFNKFLNTDYKTNQTKIENYIRAETKQSVSTLFEINRINEKKISTLPLSSFEINGFLNSLNWSYPWNSGAQYSALCVFAKTQLNEKNFEDASNALENFCNNLVNKENGLYYQGRFTTSNEVINGAMKIITGLDWLNIKEESISELQGSVCYYPFYKLFVDWNGDVLFCSNDWGKEHVVGNLLQPVSYTHLRAHETPEHRVLAGGR